MLCFGAVFGGSVVRRRSSVHDGIRPARGFLDRGSAPSSSDTDIIARDLRGSSNSATLTANTILVILPLLR